MKRRLVGILLLSLLILVIGGCSRGSIHEQTEGESVTPEQIEVSSSESSGNAQDLSLNEVMDRIMGDQGLDKAADYDNGTEDVLKDAIVTLCTSESGQYTAYGFISPEYGTAGILLNNIIDGQDNWNYLEETWSYASVKPTLEETGEYEVLFSFTQRNGGEDSIREIYFDTYDTGTMSPQV